MKAANRGKLKPGTLDTVGENDYGGKLGKSQVFSAHGKIHPATGDHINFGAGISGFGARGPKPCLDLYRVDARGTLYTQGKVASRSFRSAMISS